MRREAVLIACCLIVGSDSSIGSYEYVDVQRDDSQESELLLNPLRGWSEPGGCSAAINGVLRVVVRLQVFGGTMMECPSAWARERQGICHTSAVRRSSLPASTHIHTHASALVMQFTRPLLRRLHPVRLLATRPCSCFLRAVKPILTARATPRREAQQCSARA
jgi:hypothetical protein